MSTEETKSRGDDKAKKEAGSASRAQMRKGVLEFCILCILSEKDAYPSEIIEAMKEAKLIVVEGTLYPLLMRLKNEGHLGYEWKESTGGPPRKYYKLTDSGKSFLEELYASWNELVASVKLIAKKYSSNTLS